MAPRFHILSPKRNKLLQTGWEGFFPCYAGFPDVFARELQPNPVSASSNTSIILGDDTA